MKLFCILLIALFAVIVSSELTNGKYFAFYFQLKTYSIVRIKKSSYNEYNKNNKKIIEEICALPAKGGPEPLICRAMLRRWFYNSESKQCETFIFSGCGGNENNFNTEEECKEKCVK